MKFKDVLNEKWKTQVDSWGDEIDVFINPSSKELKELIDDSGSGELKMLLTKKNELYAFVGDVEHRDIAAKLKLSTAGLVSVHHSAYNELSIYQTQSLDEFTPAAVKKHFKRLEKAYPLAWWNRIRELLNGNRSLGAESLKGVKLPKNFT